MLTLSEYMILIAFDRLWRDCKQDRLPCPVITHLALHIAEFPTLVPLASVLDHDDEGRVTFPAYVIDKVGRDEFDRMRIYVLLSVTKFLLFLFPVFSFYLLQSLL